MGLNRRSQQLVFSLLLLVQCAYACTIIHSEPADGQQFDETLLDMARVHYNAILESYGPPTKLSRLGDGMVWVYEDMELTEVQFGVSATKWPRSLFKINLGKGYGIYRGVVMTFDGEGHMTSVGQTVDDVYLGAGVGLQSVFSVTSLVNLSDVKNQPVQHDWGMTLLGTQSELLNRGQELHTGPNGVELQTTPPNSGQHSLEFP